MNTEFNWWLLIVGLVVGAALVWLVIADSTRREADLDERERADEAVWIAARLGTRGAPLPPERIEAILRLHRDYLAGPPPDDPDDAASHVPAAHPEPWPDRADRADGVDGADRADRADLRRDRETEPGVGA